MSEDILKDSRFAHLIDDPRYKYVPKTERKVKIDKRFQSMFNDKKFKVSYSIDKRGRPVSKTSTEDLKKFYDISSEEDSEEEDNETESEDEPNESGNFVRAPEKSSSEDETETDINDETKNVNDKLQRGDIGKEIKKRLKDLDVDYARGEANILTDSSSDEESSSEEEPELELQHCWGELDCDAEHTEESTHRLAACNMDWDRMRAADIMVLCNSFLPKGGLIHSVTIYPSEYGLKRMAEEDAKGPIELTTAQENETDIVDDENNEEGSKFHMERLRQYQLNRLKYYYAVIVLDSKETAEKLYNECDGLEYESSATKLDLRFIPDDVTFDEKPHEVCTELPELTKYQPRQFTTTALQQAKVELTWDETCPERKEITQKLMSGKIDDVTDADLRDYLASSSGEEDSEENGDLCNSDANVNDENSDKESSNLSTLDKYKALLQDIHKEEEAKKNKGIEMEVSWGLGLKDKTEKLVKEKLSKKDEMTPFEKMVDKIKEKKKAKREERKKKLEQEESDSSDDIPDGIDMNDPYFAEEFQNPEFEKPKTKTKKKKAAQMEDGDSNDEKAKQELELLLMDDKEEEKEHFSLKKIQDAENDTKSKSKRRKKLLKRKAQDLSKNKELTEFEVDVNDERFSALYTSHHFNIDPTDSHYKKTKGMETLINAKLNKRAMNDNMGNGVSESLNKKHKKDIAVNMMVRNIKRNAMNQK